MTDHGLPYDDVFDAFTFDADADLNAIRFACEQINLQRALAQIASIKPLEKEIQRLKCENHNLRCENRRLKDTLESHKKTETRLWRENTRLKGELARGQGQKPTVSFPCSECVCQGATVSSQFGFACGRGGCPITAQNSGKCEMMHPIPQPTTTSLVIHTKSAKDIKPGDKLLLSFPIAVIEVVREIETIIVANSFRIQVTMESGTRYNVYPQETVLFVE